MCACEREVCLGCVRELLFCVWFSGCVLELVVCRVRFARVSCPCLRFGFFLPVYRVRSKLFNFIATLRAGRQPSCAGVCELQGHYGLRAAPLRVSFATRRHDGLEQES